MIKRWITATPMVDGEWKRISEVSIHDSFLGRCESDPPQTYGEAGDEWTTNLVFRTTITFTNIGQVQISFGDGNLDIEIKLARAIVAGFPRKDHWYRLVLAWDHRDFHRVMSEGPVLSVRQLAAQLKPYRIEIYNVINSGTLASVWYSCGRLMGGARLCIVLDDKARFQFAAIG